MAEQTLEQLFETIETLSAKVDTFVASEDKEKKDAAKKAEDETKEKEKMEAKRATRDAAIKAAMEEEDPDKRDAAIKAATAEYDDKKKEAFGKPDNEKTAEEKEKDAQIASIIEDKKQEFITKILTANSYFNPQGLQVKEASLKSASLAKVEHEWSILAPAFEGSVQARPSNPRNEQLIGYMANVSPGDIDKNQLNANSPDTDFTKFTTKELLEMSS